MNNAHVTSWLRTKISRSSGIARGNVQSSGLAYKEYWTFTLIRGLLAVITAVAIVFTTAMSSTVILDAPAVVLEILILGAYVTLDSALVLITSFTIPRQRPGRVPLQLQGVGGAILGLFLFSLVYNRLDRHWFLYLFAVQAAVTAVTEFMVARGTAEHHEALWCYAASAIAAASAIGLLTIQTSPGWIIYGYLSLLGFNLLALSARMLFGERLHYSSAAPEAAVSRRAV